MVIISKLYLWMTILDNNVIYNYASLNTKLRLAMNLIVSDQFTAVKQLKLHQLITSVHLHFTGSKLKVQLLYSTFLQTANLQNEEKMFETFTLFVTLTDKEPTTNS